MDSGEIVVSSIRTGMKREFAMMMKAQSEIGGFSAGGRRMTRSQSTAGSSKGYLLWRGGKQRKVGAELREDMPLGIESTVPQFRGTDGDSIHEYERPIGETTDLRMKMSKKVELSRIPTKLKDLLLTGLLEGLPVRYIHGSKLSVYGEHYPSAPASSSCPPVVSESAQISSDSQPQTKHQGMLTRKDLRMYKSVLAEDVLPEGTALSYVIHGRKSLRVTRKMAVSPSQFEAHAGFASHRKPYPSSYPKAVKHLQRNTADPCSICEDWGEICYAVKTVHEAFTPKQYINSTECLGLSDIPRGIWFCKYCQNMFEKKKFAEPDANALAAGRVPGVDPLEAITQLCIRVVGKLEPEIRECAICRFSIYFTFSFLALLLVTLLRFVFLGAIDFCKSKFTARTIIICDQSEKEYHVGCLKEQNIDDLKKLVGDGEQRLLEALSDVLKMKCEGQVLQKNPELGIRWRLLRGKKATEDSRVWLSGAVLNYLPIFTI
ncbi:hypothetical protein Sango_2487200 [Sesamum angolense]|uniref:Uncharacterized protein n=1 Tax=Sesamum angolense TaxID=2727404 RepID=A0AAE2BI40_9LAMI|nr:hypothetical protein Sango_2487200 [Sesamum angolense]